LIHRHLDYPPGTPITQVGDDALDDLLSRGDLRDWQPLLREIRASPHGALADRVLNLLEANPRYGTTALLRAWIHGLRSGAETGVDRPAILSDLRRLRGLTQAEMASRLGMSQSDLSKLERRTDWKLSTLRAFVAGLGWRLHLLVLDEEGTAVRSVGDPGSR
jgi:hypothetical protein